MNKEKWYLLLPMATIRDEAQLMDISSKVSRITVKRSIIYSREFICSQHLVRHIIVIFSFLIYIFQRFLLFWKVVKENTQLFTSVYHPRNCFHFTSMRNHKAKFMICAVQGSYRAWKTWKTLKTWKNTLILPQSGKSQGKKLGIEESQGKVREFYK